MHASNDEYVYVAKLRSLLKSAQISCLQVLFQLAEAGIYGTSTSSIQSRMSFSFTYFTIHTIRPNFTGL
jgi:hypothetical protein